MLPGRHLRRRLVAASSQHGTVGRSPFTGCGQTGSPCRFN